jgi:MFS family permease
MITSKSRNKLFYGWWIVISAFIISFLSGGAVFFGFTAILDPLIKQFGWSYTQVSLAASLRGMGMGLFAPIIGVLVDRWGPRRLIFVGAICVSLGLVLLSRVNSLVMFYSCFVLIAIGMSNLTGTVSLTAVANWFREKVALATGLVVSGTAVGGVLVPVVSLLIDKYGWRMAVIILGLGIGALTIPLSLVFRHKPEQYGYLPDGKPSLSGFTDENRAEVTGADENVRDGATRTMSRFWHLAVASFFHMMVTSAVITHIMPYLTSSGVSRSAASLAAGVLAVVSAGGRLGSGWLGDKFDKRKIAGLGLAMVSSGMLFFALLKSIGTWLLSPFIILFSTGWGGVVTLRAALLREYYPRSKFGRMFGLLAGIAMLGNVVGAPLAGWVVDRWHTYQGIWFVFAGFAAIAVVLVLTIPPVRNKVAD